MPSVVRKIRHVSHLWKMDAPIWGGKFILKVLTELLLKLHDRIMTCHRSSLQRMAWPILDQVVHGVIPDVARIDYVRHHLAALFRHGQGASMCVAISCGVCLIILSGIRVTRNVSASFTSIMRPTTNAERQRLLVSRFLSPNKNEMMF